jgi:L,D-transpeptidase ErfK/SrfK
MIQCNVRHYYQSALLIIALFFAPFIYATTFTVPSAGNSILGEVQYTTSYASDSTATLAQRYNLGLNSIVNANPGVAENSILPPGLNVTVSTAFILPPLPRKGIIINLPEMRMYYFPPGTNTVMTFPIGIGRIGKTIPIENTAIIRKVTNPSWFPTPDIREFNRKQGIDLPKEMGPGPDNPLGPYAIYLRIPTYLIHSTIFPESIGRRASFGCIRMNEADIKEFFPLVNAGTPVAIVDMPAKVGWENGRLYLQAYPPLQERTDLPHAKLSGVVELVQQNIPAKSRAFINWQMVAYVAEQPDGIPHEIGFKLN